MKILFLLAATAFTVAMAADDKPKAVSSQTPLTVQEHDELTKLFITAQAQDIAAREARDEATKAAQAFHAKQEEFRRLHLAVGCTWAFFDKKWSCPDQRGVPAK